jgi:hypothetical protein
MPRATWNGAVLAESDRCLVVEGNQYFPPDAVKREYFKPSETHTVCSWKGTASYYDVVVDGEVNKDAAWYYPRPRMRRRRSPGTSRSGGASQWSEQRRCTGQRSAVPSESREQRSEIGPEAQDKRQKAKDTRQRVIRGSVRRRQPLALLALFTFCLLPFAFCLVSFCLVPRALLTAPA